MYMSSNISQSSRLQGFQVKFRRLLSWPKYSVRYPWASRQDWDTLVASLCCMDRKMCHE